MVAGDRRRRTLAAAGGGSRKARRPRLRRYGRNSRSSMRSRRSTGTSRSRSSRPSVPPPGGWTPARCPMRFRSWRDWCAAIRSSPPHGSSWATPRPTPVAWSGRSTRIAARPRSVRTSLLLTWLPRGRCSGSGGWTKRGSRRSSRFGAPARTGDSRASAHELLARIALARRDSAAAREHAGLAREVDPRVGAAGLRRRAAALRRRRTGRRASIVRGGPRPRSRSRAGSRSPICITTQGMR